LPEDGDDEVAMALLCFVTKIAIKVGQACRTRLLQRFDVFNYSGTFIATSASHFNNSKEITDQSTLLPEPTTRIQA